MLNRLREYNRLKKNLKSQQRNQIHPRIGYYNFLQTNWGKLWFHRYLTSSGLMDKTDKTIAFWSVFGDAKLVDYVKADVNVFYTGENLHRPEHKHYADYMLNNQRVQLGMGFDYNEADNYLRFPLWLLYFFNDCFTYEQVANRCEEINHPNIGEKIKFAAVIASWDPTGVRAEICDSLADLGKIDYAGKWRHNDDSLLKDFADNKLEYLRQYNFNICPENSNCMGYTTEKIWEAIVAGCIPVYWGSYGLPERGILNPNAIIQLSEPKDKETLQTLVKDPAAMKQYLVQDRLLPTASTEIYKMIENLENKLNTLLQ